MIARVHIHHQHCVKWHQSGHTGVYRTLVVADSADEVPAAWHIYDLNPNLLFHASPGRKTIEKKKRIA